MRMRISPISLSLKFKAEPPYLTKTTESSKKIEDVDVIKKGSAYPYIANYRLKLWPNELSNKFEEMSPLFSNTDIKFDDIGEFMQNYVREHNLNTKPRRLLVSGMRVRFAHQDGVWISRVLHTRMFILQEGSGRHWATAKRKNRTKRKLFKKQHHNSTQHQCDRMKTASGTKTKKEKRRSTDVTVSRYFKSHSDGNVDMTRAISGKNDFKEQKKKKIF